MKDVSSAQIDKIDPLYYKHSARINVKDDTKINANQQESDAYYSQATNDSRASLLSPPCTLPDRRTELTPSLAPQRSRPTSSPRSSSCAPSTSTSARCTPSRSTRASVSRCRTCSASSQTWRPTRRGAGCVSLFPPPPPFRELARRPAPRTAADARTHARRRRKKLRPRRASTGTRCARTLFPPRLGLALELTHPPLDRLDRLQKKIEQWRAHLLAYEVQLLDPEYLAKCANFGSLVMAWLVRLVDPLKRHPQTRIRCVGDRLCVSSSRHGALGTDFQMSFVLAACRSPTRRPRCSACCPSSSSRTSPSSSASCPSASQPSSASRPLAAVVGGRSLMCSMDMLAGTRRRSSRRARRTSS